MNKPYFTTVLLCLFCIAVLNCKSSVKIPTPNPLPVFTFAKGADVGWLSQMEHDAVIFYNNTGAKQDCIQILKDKGMNSIRLRVWVNPSAGWCNKSDVVAQAIRAKNAGMRVMIDFHYSDTWADPGHQYKPAAWTNLNLTELAAAIASHTTNILLQLQSNGITPEWVQVGNETNDGMLWEEGRASQHMEQFAALIKAGYNAVKAVSKNIKVIVHISNGYNNGLFRWIFDGLRNNDVNWDIIGMSLYPNVADWAATTTQCLTNMTDMIDRYGKEIMICEVGMPNTEPAVCKAFLQDIIAKTKSLPDNKGLGVFYWEPESYNNWQGYTLGAFDNTGKPTIALDAFKD